MTEIIKSSDLFISVVRAGAGYAGRVSVTESSRSTKGDRTRRRLLNIAVGRFAVDGYRHTSASEIARDAGVTPAAVYAYFANKEALFSAAVDADASALIDAARSAMRGRPVRDRLVAILGTLGERIDAHPLARRVLSGQEPDVIDRVLELPSLVAFTAEIATDLAAAQRAGQVRVDIDPATIASGLEAIVLTLLMGSLQTRERADSRRAIGALAVLDAALRVPA